MDMSQYMSAFLDESREHLQIINDVLLKLEKDPDEHGFIEEIFRSAHTLKGMSATMGFTKTAELTHNMENVLDKIRNREMVVTPDIVDVLFECLDALNVLLDEIIEDGEEETEIELLANQLDGIAKSGKVSKEKEKVVEPEKVEESVTIESEEINEKMIFNEFDKQLLEEAKAKNLNSYMAKVELESDCMLKAARTYMIFRAIEESGDIIKTNPPAQDLEEEKFDTVFFLTFITDRTAEEVKMKVLNISEVKDIEISEVDVTKELKSKGEEEKKEVKKTTSKEEKGKKAVKEKSIKKVKKTTTVRVETGKLDSLMNLVAELVINKTRLAQIGSEYELQELSETLSHIDRVTSDLQSVVTQVRMVPIENVFNRFPRMVRDLSKDIGKEIELIIEGKETELDRTVIDEIGDPLVHLIRNSLDHGIELPSVRETSGKERKGTILLKAEHEGNSVVITISDNGKGIDPKIIGNIALEKELTTEDELAVMDDEQILKFIFAAGFSTAEEITDLSGRGVGMDVVRNKIEGLNGQIELSSEVGVGTLQRIKLPLTLAIIEALLVNLKNETYAIPLANIVETIDVDKKDVKVMQNEDVIVLRGEVVPIINLGETLNVPEYKEPEAINHTIVIVKVGSKKIGLIIDQLIGQQEIVIKSLGKLFTGVRGITGATVLGNGEVALILDVLTLL